MPDWDLLLTEAHIATLQDDGSPYGIVTDAALAISDGRIAWLGPADELPAGQAADSMSAGGRWLTPALIDCHTHLVFGGDRAAEFEQRRMGKSYEDIAREGGGIMSTVEATRAASTRSLVQDASRRLDTLRREGVATVEIKSGYGLDLDTEIRMLEAARTLDEMSDVTVVATFLGAHTVPAEYRGRANDYIDLVCDEMLPAIAERGLADAVDAYCESIAFSAIQVRRVFERATELGFRVRLHAGQLSDGGSAEIAASFDALSADHLEYTSENGVKALAAAGSVAVLLPGAFVTLAETQRPPVDLLRQHKVPIAVATDCNPGTSPLCSLQTAMTLASTVFGLTPAECLAGSTRNAARALGLDDDRGTLAVGKRADIAIWNIEHPRELSYWTGLHLLGNLIINGKRQ